MKKIESKKKATAANVAQVIKIANPKGLGWYVGEHTGLVNSKGILHPDLTALVLTVYNNLHTAHAMTEEGQAQIKASESHVEIERGISFNITDGLASAANACDHKGDALNPQTAVSLAICINQMLFALSGYDLTAPVINLSLKDGYSLICSFIDARLYTNDNYSTLSRIFTAAAKSTGAEDGIYFGAILHAYHNLIVASNKVIDEAEEQERAQRVATA